MATGGAVAPTRSTSKFNHYIWGAVDLIIDSEIKLMELGPKVPLKHARVRTSHLATSAASVDIVY